MRAADTAVICINATAGIQVTSEKVWTFATEIGLPAMIHLTKMDRDRASLEDALGGLRKTWGREVVPVQIPIGSEHEFEGIIDLVSQKAYMYSKDGDGKGKIGAIPEALQEEVQSRRTTLIEAVAETDDALMEEFFEVGSLPDEDLIKGLRLAILNRKIFPLTMSSGGHGIGTASLLDSIVDLLPDPIERGTFPAQNIGGEPMEVATGAEEPMSTLIFKTMSDPFTGKITLMRVASGTLDGDTVVWNVQQERDEKIGHLMALQGKHGSNIQRLVTGDIGGVAKLKSAKTGETLCAKQRPVRLTWMEPKEAAISFAIEPKSKGDEEKIGESLSRLMDEDPTLQAHREQETGEFLLSGTGQLHVEIAVAKLKKRFHVEVILHPPKVPYRETIRRKADGHGRHKKQTGGRGQFADCRIIMEPSPGSGFEFIDEIFGGSIPQGYRPAVEKGIREASKRGYLAGYPVVGFKVRLKDGQYHDVDSSEMAFKIAGSLAFKDAMGKAMPTLMEPVMKVDIYTTEEFMGDIMSDLSQRRGKPQGMDSQNGKQVVNAVVPMSEMLDYAPALRSMTQGRSSFHIEMSHYEEVPKQIQQKIMAQAQKEKEEEHH